MDIIQKSLVHHARVLGICSSSECARLYVKVHFFLSTLSDHPQERETGLAISLSQRLIQQRDIHFCAKASHAHARSTYHQMCEAHTIIEPLLLEPAIISAHTALTRHSPFFLLTPMTLNVSTLISSSSSSSSSSPFSLSLRALASPSCKDKSLDRAFFWLFPRRRRQKRARTVCAH